MVGEKYNVKQFAGLFCFYSSVKQNNLKSMEAKEYISRSEAVVLAGITSGTITKWMQIERFSCVGAGKF